MQNETPYDEKKSAVVEDVRPVGAEPHQPRPAASREELKRVFRRAAWYSVALTLIVAIIGEQIEASTRNLRTYCLPLVSAVPLPMFFSHYVFSKGFYTFWVACTM